MLENSFHPVFDIQEIFRVIMDGMAKPGKINRVPVTALSAPGGLSPFVASVCLTLLDSEVSFHVKIQAWENYLHINTGSVAKPAPEADFVIVEGEQTPEGIEFLRRGSLLFPDRGSTLIISVESIATYGGGLVVEMTGPGIPGLRRILVKGLNAGYLSAISSINEEYPLGVDTIMVDRTGSVVCVPRSVSFTWEEDAEWAMSL